MYIHGFTLYTRDGGCAGATQDIARSKFSLHVPRQIQRGKLITCSMLRNGTEAESSGHAELPLLMTEIDNKKSTATVASFPVPRPAFRRCLVKARAWD